MLATKPFLAVDEVSPTVVVEVCFTSSSRIEIIEGKACELTKY